MTKISDFLASLDGGAELVAEERLIVAVSEMVAAEMQRKGVTRAALAESLGCSKAHVTKLLGGSRNMTLRTLAAIAHALDAEPRFQLAPRAGDQPGEVDDGWDTRPHLIGKVIRLCPQGGVAAGAANDGDGWSPPLRIVNRC